MLGAQKDLLTWDAVFDWIKRDWPEVAQISTLELAGRMVASSEANPLLIDVRTHEEYEVSHLPGASGREHPARLRLPFAKYRTEEQSCSIARWVFDLRRQPRSWYGPDELTSLIYKVRSSSRRTKGDR
jgi:hypothetical protein